MIGEGLAIDAASFRLFDELTEKGYLKNCEFDIVEVI